MKQANRRVTRSLKILLWGLYAVNWLGGVAGHLLFGGTPAGMRWAAPAFLLLATLILISAEPEEGRALSISFFVGFLAEVIGVATALPFGKYVYSGVLAPSLFGVPPVMAGAWMILTAWVRQLRTSFWAGAFILVCFDLVIDPLAANTLGFWKWQNPGPYYGVPLINFAGWLLVSLLIMWLVRPGSLVRNWPRPNIEVFALGCSILLFFAFVGVAHHYFLPPSIAALLCGAGYWRWRSSIESTRI